MKKLKKTLSLTLAFALSLAMAVPAMAAGTPKTVDDPKRGLSVTFNGYLMDTIFDSGERAEEFHSSDYHIYVDTSMLSAVLRTANFRKVSR